MALYSSKRVCEKQLTDGSLLRFKLPLQRHLNAAMNAFMRGQAELGVSLTDGMSKKQLAFAERERDRAEQRQERPAKKKAEPKSWSERMWDDFRAYDHATLIRECYESWTYETKDGERAAIADKDDLEAVPPVLLEEAARAIFGARVATPDKIRGN